MARDEDELTRISPDTLIVTHRELDQPIAILERALTAERAISAVLAWPLSALDRFVDLPGERLVLGHTMGKPLLHEAILAGFRWRTPGAATAVSAALCLVVVGLW